MKLTTIVFTLLSTALAVSLEHPDLGTPYRPFEHTKRGEHTDLGTPYRPFEHTKRGEHTDLGTPYRPFEHTKRGEHVDLGTPYRPFEHTKRGEHTDLGSPYRPFEHTKRGEHADLGTPYRPFEHTKRGEHTDLGTPYRPFEHTERSEPAPLYNAFTEEGNCLDSSKTEGCHGGDANPEHGLGPYAAYKDSTASLEKRKVEYPPPYIRFPQRRAAEEPESGAGAEDVVSDGGSESLVKPSLLPIDWFP